MRAEKIVRPFGTGQITIPVEFRRHLKISNETLLKVVLREGVIEIKPLRIEEGEGSLRDYSLAEIEQFIADDALDSLTAARVREMIS